MLLRVCYDAWSADYNAVIITHVLDTDYSYLDHFMIIIITTAGYNTTLCGCMPWIGRVLPVSTIQCHDIVCFLIV